MAILYIHSWFLIALDVRNCNTKVLAFITVQWTVFTLAMAIWAYFNTWGMSALAGLWYNRIHTNNPMSRRQFDDTERLFLLHIPFFASLSDEARARFISRAYAFAKGRDFIGMEGYRIDMATRLLVGAAAAQLTFGMTRWELDHIKRVLIYPRQFYHRWAELWMKGGVSKNGTMLLSWEDFLAGFANGNDNYNLGLHEMAHALKLDQRATRESESFFTRYIDVWLSVARPEFTSLAKGQPGFLRAYGGTNEHEFFAVCVEHFYESPEAFSVEHPDVFNHLCLLLNINPLNRNDDFALTDAFRQSVNTDPARLPIPRRTKSYRGFNRFHSQTMVLCIFLYMWLQLSTPNDEPAPVYTTHILLLPVAVALGIQLPYIYKNGYANLFWMALFSLGVLGLSGIAYLALL